MGVLSKPPVPPRHCHSGACIVVAELCPTLCGPMTVARQAPLRGISQARILEWVATSSSGDLPNPGTESASPALAGGHFTTEPPGKPGVFKKELFFFF